jgi:hypothetical protein
MRLYTHDLRSIPAVELRSGDCITSLNRDESHILLDVHPVDPAEDRARFDRGEQCYVGWSAGRPAYYCWVQDKGVHEIRGTWRSEPIQPGDFWIYSVRTAEWARGRRLNPAAVVTVLRDYKSRGYRRALAYIAEENIASLKSVQHTGFVFTERIRSFAWRTSLLRLPGSRYRASTRPGE